ncbi:MAG: Type toxin-antitoxin system VapC family toxin [Dehalococcoidia bacterium]|nr:Type toxin-antitoxin system VapC family toxin [Dehalococcoidia bacterium]
MPDTRSRVYWDADVFLSYINQILERMPILDTLLNQSSSPTLPFKIVTSTYSMVEVAFGAQEQVQGVLSTQTEEDIDSLWDPATVQLIEFHPGVAVEARRLMRLAILRGWKLKPGDAIQLATAKVSGAEELHTYSKDFPRYSADIGIPIKEPNTQDPQGRMPI